MSDSYNPSSVNNCKDNVSGKSTSNSKSSSTAGSPQAALTDADTASKKGDGEKCDDGESEGSTKIKEMINDIDGAQKAIKDKAPDSENKSTYTKMGIEGKSISIANTSTNIEKTMPTIRIQQ